LPSTNQALITIYKLSILYGGFAFIVSLIREVVKDIEDEVGDRKYGCRTMPIVWGINSSKVFIAVWIITLFGSLSAIMVYALINKWYYIGLYILTILLPIIANIFLKLKKAMTIRRL